MSAEEYVDSLPMWATKKNSVAGVKRFLEELLSDAVGSEGHRGGPAQVTFGTASAPAGAASGSKAPEGRRLRTGAPDGPSVTCAGPGIPVVHIAGTNGKGSVSAYLTQAFLDSGLHTGTFVSPHLVDVKERILLDNVPVDAARFAEACRRVKEAAERFCSAEVGRGGFAAVTFGTASAPAGAASGSKASEGRRLRTGAPDGPSETAARPGEVLPESGIAWPTYFEFLYYMAMLIFRDAAVDVIVLETGLGGRLDATNSCSPALTVITSISLDHMQYLGDTTEKIAAEKAGIIKPGIPVVFDPNDAAAARVIRKRAAELGSAAYEAYPPEERRLRTGAPDGPSETGAGSGEDRREGPAQVTFGNAPAPAGAASGSKASEIRRLRTGAPDGPSVTCARPGEVSHEVFGRFAFLDAPYKRQNAAVALKAWQVLRMLPVFRKETGEPCSGGPGGFLESDAAFIESVRRTRWTGRMQEIFPDVFLDGAHNEDGIRAMIEAAKGICDARGKKPVLLTSAVNDKDLKSIVHRITGELRPARIYAAPLDSYRAANVGEIADLYRANGMQDVQVYSSVAEAFAAAKSGLWKDEILFCAGSLYMVGEILAAQL